MNAALDVKIGTASVTLNNYDKDGNRLVRTGETNSGSFAADALYYLFDSMDMDVDAAIMNGGGVRNGAITGDLTYKTCKQIHTFGNVACLQTVTGQQLLDIPLSELYAFRDHPFKVQDDERMLDTAQSIREYGVLVPAIARPRKDHIKVHLTPQEHE